MISSSLSLPVHGRDIPVGLLNLRLCRPRPDTAQRMFVFKIPVYLF